MVNRYVSVCIPKKLAALIDEKLDPGYTSRADFIKQAVRNELRRLK